MKEKKKKYPRAAALIPAGGSSRRMGGLPKQFRELGDKRLLDYSLESLHKVEVIGEIVVAVPENKLEELREYLAKYPKVKCVSGGEERWQSVGRAFETLTSGPDVVLVHDAARPFLSSRQVLEGLQAVMNRDCVITALPATDTLKRVSGDRVLETVDRTQLIEVQTPQYFRASVLQQIFAAADGGKIPAHQLTDEAGMAEALGLDVHWIRGSVLLRKITYVEDWDWAAWALEKQKRGEA